MGKKEKTNEYDKNKPIDYISPKNDKNKVQQQRTLCERTIYVLTF
jgi:hypothetical protein